MKSNEKCSRPRDDAAGFTIVELSLVIGIIGIVAAIAIPNFIKFQARSKQSEAKANLKAMYVQEKQFFQEKDTFNSNVSQLGFGPGHVDETYLYDISFTTTSLHIHAAPA